MSFEHASNPSDDNERLRLNNAMQIGLMRKYFGFDAQNEQKLQWVKKYGLEFNKLISEQPELLNMFRDNPDKTLEQAEEFLYLRHKKEK